MRTKILPVEAYDEIQCMLEDNGADYCAFNPSEGETIEIVVNDKNGRPYLNYVFDDELYESLD